MAVSDKFTVRVNKLRKNMASRVVYEMYRFAVQLTPGSAGSALVFVIVAGSLYILITTIISWRRLSHIPGPFVNSITYWPMFQTRWSGQLPAMVTYAKLSQTYGPLVRIGPRDLLTSDAELVRRMSAVRSTYGRSSWYKSTRLYVYSFSSKTESWTVCETYKMKGSY